MFSFTLGAVALAMAASGAFAQNTGQAGAEPAPPQDTQQRGGPPGAAQPGNARAQRDEAKRAGDTLPRTTDLRDMRNAARDARVPADIPKNKDRREVSKPAQTDTARPGPSARGNTGLREVTSREGTERVLERMVSGPPDRPIDRQFDRPLDRPLDRSVRTLVRCPPGLARNGGCAPPGQAKSSVGQRESLLGRAYSPLLFGLTGFDEGRYLYRDGYLLQLGQGSGTDSANGIAGFIPLLGGALASGNIWPGSYGSQNVPAYLVDFYNLGQPGSYRYADNTLYRLDPQSAAIQSIAALLTDEEVAVGEPMPAGYDVYNVPFPHRDRFADSAEAAYRYVDGYVYRLDPETRLVTAAIDLLT